MGKGNDPNGKKCSSRSSRIAQRMAAMAVDVDSLDDDAAKAFGLTEVFKRIQHRATSGFRNAGTGSASSGESLLRHAISGYAVLDKQDEYIVVRVARNHPNPGLRAEAEQMLMLCNARFVQDQVRQKIAVWGRDGFEADELFNESIVGLRKAIDQFDLDHVNVNDRESAKFLTYARPKITGAIGRYIEENSDRIYGVRLPTGPFWEVQNMVQAMNGIDGGRGMTPEQLEEHPDMAFVGRKKKRKKDMTPEELALNEENPRDLSLSTPQLDKTQRIAKIRWAMDLNNKRGVQSLQQQVRGGNSGTYGDGAEIGDRIVDTQAATTEDEVESKLLREQILTIAKDRLSPTEYELMQSLDLHDITGGEREFARSINQLADQTSQNVVALRPLINGARRKLRQGLVEAGLGPDAKADKDLATEDFEAMMSS